MMREIGGYLELEQFTGKEYHQGLYRMNLGRTALVWLLKKLNCSRIYIPYYNCDSVMKSVAAAGVEVERFFLDENLKPILRPDFALGENEWLYVINYYGQLTEDDILDYEKKYGRIIVDNAQAFFEKPVGNIPTLYSCRKFLGVADGAYLSADVPFDDELPTDKSMDRVKYLFGRMEESARDHYSEMLAETDKFADAIPERMSLFTENILRGIDYDRIRERRLANYRILDGQLASVNPFTAREPLGPFAYPCLVENGVEVRKQLAAENIFIPTNWSYLISQAPADSLEKHWSENILPLPVDQRYGEEEMTAVAKAIKRFL
ncbi:MAG: hypothetical protein MJ161_01360 [Clostridia bacterium]|nr:hypothetical protein [Clostridia bacterium]